MATPWSSAFRDITSRSGLTDSALGHGIQTTWNARSLVMRIPIDHVLIPKSIAVNRRANKEAEVVAIRQAGKTLAGPVDHRVPVLAARSADGALVGLVFGYACHATTLSFDKWCADYPGYACESLEKSNPGAVCAFMAGCGADQNPLPRRHVQHCYECNLRINVPGVCRWQG